MTAAELIAILSQMPDDAEVVTHYDGAARGGPVAAWLTNDGEVAIGDLREPVYDDGNRCVGAVPSAQNPYLSVAEMLGIPDPEEPDDFE